MKGYGHVHIFSMFECAVFDRVTRMVEAVEEPASVGQVRCHELARAVAFHLGASSRFGEHNRTVDMTMDLSRFCVVDGKYGAVNHSWIEWTSMVANDGKRILDVYSVGRLPMVQLISLGSLLPQHQALYKETSIESLHVDIDTETIDQLLRLWRRRWL